MVAVQAPHCLRRAPRGGRGQAAAAAWAAAARFALTSFTAALMASSASMEQCSLTGGRWRCLAMSVFFTASASSMCLPLCRYYMR